MSNPYTDWLGEAASRLSTQRAAGVDTYLAGWLAAGIDPNDFILEEGPMTSSWADGKVTLNQNIRLRPKTEWERAKFAGQSQTEQTHSSGHAGHHATSEAHHPADPPVSAADDPLSSASHPQ